MKDYTANDWFELGKYHSSIQNPRSAINCYKNCIYKNPRHFQAWNNMAAEYFHLKLYQKSIECCKETIRINQHDKKAWLNLAANFFQLNDDGRAYFCFDRASILGSKKAERFLEKAKRMNDQMLTAKLIDVTSEIFKEKVKKIKKEEVKETKIKKPHIPKVPKLKEDNYDKHLQAFLLEIGNTLIIKTGGVISILELFSFIKSNYPSFDGKPTDIINSLKQLEKGKLIEGIKTLNDSNILIVEFVPSELTSDIKSILEIAMKKEYLTYDDIISEKSWDHYRIERTLKFLESKNLAKKVGSYLKGEKWYFPSLKEN
ncbi:MAG: tetratricopeptide repeat protein [Candidatus Hermodarchaeota archaeon]